LGESAQILTSNPNDVIDEAQVVTVGGRRAARADLEPLETAARLAKKEIE
jgi:hypothetical protein